MIAAAGLTRIFGDRTAVADLTFTIETGQVCALLGPNGAGKTTTVRMLLGLIGPSRGSATVAGIAVPNTGAELARLRGNVGLLTETPGFYDRLSAVDNLTLFGRLYGIESRILAGRIVEYLERLGLADRGADLVATYSKGMKQRLALIRAIFHQPDVIFFDEPTSGLDPESARDVRLLIRSLKEAGRTIVVCTHNLTEAAELADVVAVIKGRLLAFGPPTSLGQRDDVRRLRIVVGAGQLDRAVAALGALPGGPPAVIHGAAIELDLTATTAPVPGIVAALVRAEVDVFEVRPIELSLEDRYLRAIGDR